MNPALGWLSAAARARLMWSILVYLQIVPRPLSSPPALISSRYTGYIHPPGHRIQGKYVLIGLFHVSPPYNWRPSLILNQQEPSHYNPDILQIMASKLHHHLDSQLLNSLTTVDVVWIDTR